MTHLNYTVEVERNGEWQYCWEYDTRGEAISRGEVALHDGYADYRIIDNRPIHHYCTCELCDEMRRYETIGRDIEIANNEYDCQQEYEATGYLFGKPRGTFCRNGVAKAKELGSKGRTFLAPDAKKRAQRVASTYDALRDAGLV